MELSHGVGLVEASDQELLGPGPSLRPPGGRPWGARGAPPPAPAEPRRWPAPRSGGAATRITMCSPVTSKAGRDRAQTRTSISEPPGASRTAFTFLLVPAHRGGETPCYRPVIPEATMSRQWRRRERVPGRPGRSEPGTVRARRPDPANILPEPPPEPGPPTGARSRRGRAPPVTAVGRPAPGPARPVSGRAREGPAKQGGTAGHAPRPWVTGRGVLLSPRRGRTAGGRGMTRYRPVDAKVDLPALEERRARVLARARHLPRVEPTCARALPSGSSTTARRRRTASPHIGHVEARTFKDMYPRFRTMRGHSVVRKARMGLPRPAGRGRGGEGDRHQVQARHRGVRRRRVRRAVPRVGPALRGRTGSA